MHLFSAIGEAVEPQLFALAKTWEKTRLGAC
jgi:hypothetical protein